MWDESEPKKGKASSGTLPSSLLHQLALNLLSKIKHISSQQLTERAMNRPGTSSTSPCVSGLIIYQQVLLNDRQVSVLLLASVVLSEVHILHMLSLHGTLSQVILHPAFRTTAQHKIWFLSLHQVASSSRAPPVSLLAARIPNNNSHNSNLSHSNLIHSYPFHPISNPNLPQARIRVSPICRAQHLA